MSVATKSKPPPESFHSTAQLFNQISELFHKPSKKLSAQVVANNLREYVQRLERNVSYAELEFLHGAVKELSAQIDQLRSVAATDAPANSLLSKEQSIRQEDIHVQRMLNTASQRETVPLSKPESVRKGNEAMVTAREASCATTQVRIEKKELISSGEMQVAMDMGRQALSSAMKAGRIFAIVGPSGKNYYPAFYADARIDRRSLEKVAKALGALPSVSKYFFFTSKSTMLQETPLDALRKGRVTEALVAAAGFAVR